MEIKRIAKIVLPIALDKEFDYSIAASLEIKKGNRVVVDFNGKKRIGIVVALEKKSAIKYLKPIIEVLDNRFSLTDENLDFADALSKVYPYPRGEFLFMMIPQYLKKIRKISEDILSPPQVLKRSPVNPGNLDIPQGLTKKSFVKSDNFLERYKIWKEIVKTKLSEGSALICFSQVSYIEEAKKVIDRDFGGQTYVIYSQQPEKELFINWKNSRQKALILGTRVSPFYYPDDLKLIVVEEENSPYYFQEEKPFYHLLDVISLLSEIKKIELILSGDYPTLSTYKLICEGKISLKEQTSADKREIKVIDMGGYTKKGIITPLLEELLRKNSVENKKMVILWNKKGFGSYLSCSVCGYILKCDRCSGFLQSSLKDNKGICPYCAKKQDVPHICKQCNSGYVKAFGLGIERIEVILKRIFPEIKIDKWEERKPDTQIVIATSKILESLYTEKIFDIGFLLDSDSFFFRLDYEATFNAFLYIKKLSLLFKEALYVFTRNSRHYLFNNLTDNFQDFYKHELALRKDLCLPPFGSITKIILRDSNEIKLLKKSQDLYNRLKNKETEVYGPFKEAPFQLRGNFRYSVIIKAKQGRHLRRIIKEEMNCLRKTHTKAAAIIR